MKRILGMLVFTVLLSEALGYRDLETGTFLTRDPIGYGDGPNVYCYVHCNPITRFDALGLYANITYTREKHFLKADSYKARVDIPIMISDKTGEVSQSQIDTYIKSTEEAFSGQFGSVEVETVITVVPYQEGLTVPQLDEMKVNRVDLISHPGYGPSGGDTNGKRNTDVDVRLNNDDRTPSSQDVLRSFMHELGHVGGAEHDGQSGSLMADQGKLGIPMDPSRDTTVMPHTIGQILGSSDNDSKEVDTLDLDAVRAEKEEKYDDTSGDD